MNICACIVLQATFVSFQYELYCLLDKHGISNEVPQPEPDTQRDALVTRCPYLFKEKSNSIFRLVHEDEGMHARTYISRSQIMKF